IDEQNRVAFVEMVQDEVKRLHFGIIARYRLRPAELAAWQETRQARRDNPQRKNAINSRRKFLDDTKILLTAVLVYQFLYINSCRSLPFPPPPIV
ncbi:MAG: hypothetical protein PHC49_18260, partial [Desulfuromonadaceae bacterium]|nr:hypothetical protein [Desulfuromonadaceae bacterium]